MRLDDDMRRVVREQSLGFVATVCPDGTPNLSPKGTTVVWDDEHLAFLHIHSPNTVANLQANPAIEVNVVDPIVRKGYRFKGTAVVLTDGDVHAACSTSSPASGAPTSRGSWRSCSSTWTSPRRSCRRRTIPASRKPWSRPVGVPTICGSPIGRTSTHRRSRGWRSLPRRIGLARFQPAGWPATVDARRGGQMSQLVFDDDVAAKIEQLNRARDVVRRRQLLRTALDPKPGERILDVGCGPGVYVAELLAEVGPSGTVAGVDASPQMLAIAARRCEGHGNASFHEADVGSLPFSDAEFDAVFTVQVLEYVADIGTALDELHRVVRVGGRVVVWDTDWSTVSWHSSDPAWMARVLAAWDEHLVDPSLPRTLGSRLRAAGFDDVHAIGHPFVSTEDSPDVMGGAIIPLIRDYVPGHGGVSAAELHHR